MHACNRIRAISGLHPQGAYAHMRPHLPAPTLHAPASLPRVYRVLASQDQAAMIEAMQSIICSQQAAIETLQSGAVWNVLEHMVKKEHAGDSNGAGVGSDAHDPGRSDKGRRTSKPYWDRL